MTHRFAIGDRLTVTPDGDDPMAVVMRGQVVTLVRYTATQVGGHNVVIRTDDRREYTFREADLERE